MHMVRHKETALWWGSAVVTARLGDRSGGMPACWNHMLGMLLPGCPWPRAVTVMDAIAWAGRQLVPHGLSPSPLHKQGSKEQRQREAPNLPACTTCFAPPCCEPSLEEEVGLLLLSFPE